MPSAHTELSFMGRIRHLEAQAAEKQSYGREIDLNLRELVELAPAHWPTDPAESVALAARVLHLGQRWLRRAANRSRALELCAEHCLAVLQESLPALYEPDPDVLDSLFSAWRHCSLIPRELLAAILVERSTDPVRRALFDRARMERMRTAGETGALLAMLRKEPGGGRASRDRAAPSPRDLAILLALADAHHGRFDEALEWLAQESASDPRLLEVGAEIAERAGRHEDALDRLRRAALLAPDQPRIRERMVAIHLEHGALDSALDHLITLLAETGDLAHWHAFLPLLVALDPAIAQQATERMRQDAPGIHLQLLMGENRVEEVLEASEARTLTADTLWAVADFLAENDPRAAAQRYERALRVLGSTAQSRKEIQELARKLDSVQPLFASIGRRTKPRRIAREIIPLSPNATALRRELEQLFSTSFA